MGSAVCCVEDASKDDEVMDSSIAFSEGTPPNLVLSTDEHLTLDTAVAGKTSTTFGPSTDEHPRTLDVAVVEFETRDETQQHHAKCAVEELPQDGQDGSTHRSLPEKQDAQEEQGAIVEPSSRQVRVEHPTSADGIGNGLPSTGSSADRKILLRKRRQSSKEPIHAAETTSKAKRRQNKKPTRHLCKNDINAIDAVSEPKADANDKTDEAFGETDAVKKKLTLDKQWINTEEAKTERLRQMTGDNGSPDSPGSGSSRRSIRVSTMKISRTVVANLDTHVRESLCRTACLRYSASGAILYGLTEEKTLCAMGYYADADDATSFAANSSKMKFSAGPSDSPSRALAFQRLHFMSENGMDATRFRRKNIAIKYGVKSICCVPYGDGVLEVFTTTGWSKAPDIEVAELLE